MRKYILILIILVCTYGCGNENQEEKVINLLNESENMGLKLQKLSTDLESSSEVIEDINALIRNIQETENKIEEGRV